MTLNNYLQQVKMLIARNLPVWHVRAMMTRRTFGGYRAIANSRGEFAVNNQGDIRRPDPWLAVLPDCDNARYNFVFAAADTNAVINFSDLADFHISSFESRSGLSRSEPPCPGWFSRGHHGETLSTVANLSTLRHSRFGRPQL